MSTLATTSLTVSVLKALADLLEKLMGAPQRRRRARFDEFFKPLHDQFQVVHADYTRILRDLASSLPIRDESSGLIQLEYGGDYVNEEASTRAVQAAKSTFSKARDDREGIRDWLRENAKTIFSHVTEAPERRYLYVLLVYFLADDHFPYPGDREIDLRIDSILRKSSQATNTPTSWLAREIRGKVDSDSVREATNVAIVALNQRCSDVIRAYAALVAEMIDNIS